MADEQGGDAPASDIGENGKSVHVPAPAVPGGDESADEATVDLGHKEGIGITSHQGDEARGVVGAGGMGTGGDPHGEDSGHVGGRARAEVDSSVVRSGAGNRHPFIVPAFAPPSLS